jgi:hypothetical protein
MAAKATRAMITTAITPPNLINALWPAENKKQTLTLNTPPHFIGVAITP